jgi:AraC-like DNA-binding protein
MKYVRDSQLHLLWTARIDYAKGSRVDSHVHEDFNQLFVVLSGDCEVTFGNQLFQFSGESVCLLLQDAPHQFYFKSSTITLDFKFRVLSNTFFKIMSAADPCLVFSSSDLSELKRWYKLSLLQLSNPGPFLPFRIEAGLKSTLISMLLKNSDNDESPIHHLIDAAIDQYLRDNLDKRITLKQLSRLFGYNINGLIKEFSCKTGMTPIQYLQDLRLKRAKEYLAFSRFTISEIADRVGWTLPYFSNKLKSKYGVSPTKYRAILINAIGKDIIMEQDFSNEWLITKE